MYEEVFVYAAPSDHDGFVLMGRDTPVVYASLADAFLDVVTCEYTWSVYQVNTTTGAAVWQDMPPEFVAAMDKDAYDDWAAWQEGERMTALTPRQLERVRLVAQAGQFSRGRRPYRHTPFGKSDEG